MSYWFGLAFQMAVIVCAAFGIVTIILLDCWIVRDFQGMIKRKKPVLFCEHCGRVIARGHEVIGKWQLFCDDCAGKGGIE